MSPGLGCWSESTGRSSGVSGVSHLHKHELIKCHIFLYHNIWSQLQKALSPLVRQVDHLGNCHIDSLAPFKLGRDRTEAEGHLRTPTD